MTLPTPVEMPYPLPVNTKVFDLNFNQDVSPVGSGFIQTIERAYPMWVCSFDTPPLIDDRLNTFQAFLDALEGAFVPFLGFDPRRPKPYYYRTAPLASQPWTAGTVTVNSGNHVASTLSLSGFVAGAHLTRGDYIAHQQGDGPGWYLHRVRANINADGSGNCSPVVTPRPLDTFASSPARLTRACAAFKMLGRPKTKDGVGDGGTSFSFQGVQFIDRSTAGLG